MFKNYLKIAWRNLFKDKLYSFVNIMGLAIGMACCVIIYLYVSFETSYDTYHENYKQIYRMVSVSHESDKVEEFAPSSPLMGQRTVDNFPEVKHLLRFNGSNRYFSLGEKKFYDNRLFYADSSMLDVFSFEVIEGSAKNSLNKPYSVVLTESCAKKYFGSEPAYGKILQFSDTIPMTVTAVIKDVPKNTHFAADCFLSRVTMNEMNKADSTWIYNNEENWFNCNTYTYLELKDGTDPVALNTKINTLMTKENAEIRKQTGMYMNCRLQPIKDIHLNSHLDAEFKDSNNGYMVYIYIFTGTALLMLMIACFNFINLSTAKSINRSKEIGLRKVIGATRKQLMLQFLGESTLFAFLGAIISLVIVLVCLPAFNNFVNLKLHLNFSVLLIYAFIIVCVGLLSGSYPALMMSSFAPIRSLKGLIKHSMADVLFRKGLVVFQFTIAIALIVCTTVVLKQLDYIQKKHIGVNKDQLLNIELKFRDVANAEVLLKELRANPQITSASVNGFSFKYMSNITLIPEGMAENKLTSCSVFSMDESFLSTYQIKLAAGRDFSKEFASDEKEGFMVNEAAVKEFGWKTPKEAIGKKVQWGMGKDGKIIGVVKDFNFSSLKEPIKPLLFNIFKPWYNNITVRLRTENVSETIAQIEELWKREAPYSPFKYSFAEDDYNSLYQSELKMRSVLGTFTFLAIFVACLGLFGLAAFSIKQRYKEIGIRKVLGASVSGIVQHLSKDFLKPILLSILISFPLAWYVCYQWLQDFAFKTDLSLWVFIVSGLVAVIIAFSTISYQAIKAAIANPIKAIRTE